MTEGPWAWSRISTRQTTRPLLLVRHGDVAHLNAKLLLVRHGDVAHLNAKLLLVRHGDSAHLEANLYPEVKGGCWGNTSKGRGEIGSPY